MPINVRYKRLIIAIDGPAGSGKSSTAKALAKRLKLPYIDTGAMYRAVTLKAMNEKISFRDKKKLAQIAQKARIQFSGAKKVFLDGRDVTRAIRDPELTKNVFYVAREAPVRRAMVKKQQALGRAAGAVMEGRDIGTKVFPDADFKFYFDADIRLRARRRVKELALARKAPRLGLTQTLRDIRKRDAYDKKRREGPLRQAKDAIYIDTTPLTIRETVDRILRIVGRKDLSRAGV